MFNNMVKIINTIYFNNINKYICKYIFLSIYNYINIHNLTKKILNINFIFDIIILSLNNITFVILFNCMITRTYSTCLATL